MFRLVIVALLTSFSCFARIPSELLADLRFFSIAETDSIQTALKKIEDNRFSLQRQFFQQTDNNEKAVEQYQQLFKTKERIEKFYKMVGQFQFSGGYGSNVLEGPIFSFTPSQYADIVWYHIEPKVKSTFRIEYTDTAFDPGMGSPRMNTRLAARQGYYPAYATITNQYQSFKKSVTTHKQAEILQELVNIQNISKIVIDNPFIEALFKVKEEQQQEFILEALKLLSERQEWLSSREVIVGDELSKVINRITDLALYSDQSKLSSITSFLRAAEKRRSSITYSSFADVNFIYATEHLSIDKTSPLDILIERMAKSLTKKKHRAYFVVTLSRLNAIEGIDITSEMFEFYLRSLVKEINESEKLVTMISIEYTALDKKINQFIDELITISHLSEAPFTDLLSEQNIFSREVRSKLIAKLSPPDCEGTIEQIL